MTQLLSLLREIEAKLAASGIAEAKLEARILAAEALGCSRLALILRASQELPLQQEEKIRALLTRRAAHEPLGRIFGRRVFWGLSFGLNEATLEPRGDSETLVERALEALPGDRPLRILDLGTGTGCLLLAVLSERPLATGLGIDRAPRAVEQAQLNAASLGLAERAAFQTGDWLEGIEERFDMILANPPYIRSPDIKGLMPEVRDHDPLFALDGGEDGLGPYRLIAPRLPACLVPGGIAVFEVGLGQAEAVADLLLAHGLIDSEIRPDLAGIPRCVSARTAPEES